MRCSHPDLDPLPDQTQRHGRKAKLEISRRQNVQNMWYEIVSHCVMCTDIFIHCLCILSFYLASDDVCIRLQLLKEKAVKGN